MFDALSFVDALFMNTTTRAYFALKPDKDCKLESTCYNYCNASAGYSGTWLSVTIPLALIFPYLSSHRPALMAMLGIQILTFITDAAKKLAHPTTEMKRDAPLSASWKICKSGIPRHPDTQRENAESRICKWRSKNRSTGIVILGSPLYHSSDGASAEKISTT